MNLHQLWIVTNCLGKYGSLVQRDVWKEMRKLERRRIGWTGRRRRDEDEDDGGMDVEGWIK
jgi:hypothetical protein